MLLSLLRHAKTKPGSVLLADFDRPLEPQGRAALAAMSAVLAEAPPDLVLCSGALRTRQTWEEIVPGLARARGGSRPEVAIEQGLYQATAQDLLDRLRMVPDDVFHVMMIGHNPGIHDVAVALLQPSQRDGLAAGFPTAALARLTVPSWSALALAAGDLQRWASPPRA